MRSAAISDSLHQTNEPRRERTTELSESKTRVNELKRDIALDRYEPDSGAVADAILTKLKLVKRARVALAQGEGGQSPTGSAPRPADI
jgi:hypothetical protein